ncbi:hypothetical protein HLV37_06960 [Eggerthellaceae bacterium zg-1084]|uniref:hypothetical protein n=1 Tax=Berryella wangjianweii TaxID=2734634 RepID=UPI001553E287|nr:hypothetical protein [Berryella wangjianweii]NPD31588.1 hypothetical protein [Berryella wangjianweii]
MQILKDGTYRLSGLGSWLSLQTRRMGPLVAPLWVEGDEAPDVDADERLRLVEQSQSLRRRLFGWIGGARALPLPEGGECYLVEFLPGRGSPVRVHAYVNQSGCAWGTSHFLLEEPDRAPDLCLVTVEGIAGTPEVQHAGLVLVLNEDNVAEPHRAAFFGFTDEAVRVWGSALPLPGLEGPAPYRNVMASLYFNYVYRVQLGGAVPPVCRADDLEQLLVRPPFPAALAHASELLGSVRRDPQVRLFALARALQEWLDREVGPAFARKEGLSLSVMDRTSQLYLLNRSDDEESSDVSDEEAFRVEAVLNRFNIVRELLGDRAERADADEVGQAAALALDQFMCELPEVGPAAAAQEELACDLVPTSEPGEMLPEVQGFRGEWELRFGLSRRFECLRTPYRVNVAFRVDVPGGLAVLRAFVPDERLAPRLAWNAAAGCWEELDEPQRKAIVARYVRLLGIAAASCAFAQSDRLRTVRFCAVSPVWDDEGNLVESTDTAPEECGWSCTFERAAFSDHQAHRALRDDPALFRRTFGAYLRGEGCAGSCGGADVFDEVDGGAHIRLAHDLVEGRDALIPPDLRDSLGARYASELGIFFQSQRRARAESLAESLARTDTDAEAVSVISRHKEGLVGPEERAACDGLMERLVRGSLDRRDQNAVVNAYRGADPLGEALAHARSVMDSNPGEAAGILRSAVDQAEKAGRYVDTSEVVHRNFDSYCSRVLYNLARSGSIMKDLPFMGATDAGRAVEVVPDGLFPCYLELTRLSERSFDLSDDAVRFAKRAVELGPTCCSAHRQLARAHMLRGDFANARISLNHALHVAYLPAEISIAYYQLGYILWKLDEPQAGALCYLKSMRESPTVRPQCVNELQELMDEHGDEVDLVDPDQVDEALAEAGICVAPTDEVSGAFARAAQAACDAGLFRVAHDACAALLRTSSNDVLYGTARSFSRRAF